MIHFSFFRVPEKTHCVSPQTSEVVSVKRISVRGWGGCALRMAILLEKTTYRYAILIYPLVYDTNITTKVHVLVDENIKCSKKKNRIVPYIIIIIIIYH